MEEHIILAGTRESHLWDEMLEEFRRLGGLAENFCMRYGTRGRGLFALDPSRPVELYAPPNLLLPIEDIAFKEGLFRVSPSARMGHPEKIWLEHYMNEFSWGRGGSDETAATLQGVRSLPMRVREKLARSFAMEYCVGELSASLVQQHFLASRVITRGGRSVVMPIIELVNHGQGPGYDTEEGVRVRGLFSDEILVNYSDRDAIGLFASWGIVEERPFTFSLPTVLQTAFGEMVVHQETENGQSVEINLPNPVPMKLPTIAVENGRVRLSFLLLGMKGFPRLPKSIFRRAMREAKLPLDDEPFEKAQQFNRAVFLDLLKDLEAAEGGVARSLRSVCLIQLNGLNQCFGSRSI